MRKLIMLLTLLMPVSLFLAGCGDGNADQAEEKTKDQLNVYTTVYPLQYFAERIGGSYVDAHTIYPPGADEHTFEPSQKDMMTLADSDLFIYIGLGLEGFVSKAEGTLENENVTLLAAGENIDMTGTENGHSHEEGTEEEGLEEDGHSHEEDGHSHEEDGHNHGDVDPHVWLDPLYAADLAEAVKDALAEKMPQHQKEFEENYQKLAAELDSLHHEFEETIASGKHKEIIVSHAAYGYWEKRYGLEQISVSGLSTSNEPTQKELENIIKTSKEHGLNYIFFEQNVSSKLTEIVQDEVGAKPLQLHNLSVLTDENIDNEETYFTLMENNLKGIEKALNN
ncbi:metal ABC transporter solute-binding protein, Zn/Mn family [Bacillus sp. AG4(2022)]|uniref:metal ABC transporter solute-binding protein, Zn/Mn family n=1 Tax=Bacillus sp. AG4(2022) TaxID=2962594 RepID=UPI002882836C|nr:zinc ABC transporter substrate-binding protein [Bacillus sp. AG4(2022)]MDT0161654.1 zinc ABC transporter substrate-binding protein [Bacillus sp. AG4(2022)]